MIAAPLIPIANGVFQKSEWNRAVLPALMFHQAYGELLLVVAWQVKNEIRNAPVQM
jgi:hypothetical protein